MSRASSGTPIGTFVRSNKKRDPLIIVSEFAQEKGVTVKVMSSHLRSTGAPVARLKSRNDVYYDKREITLWWTVVRSTPSGVIKK